MQRLKELFKTWWPTAIVVAVILYATLNSNPIAVDKLPLIPHIDKWIHAIMFGGLFSALAFDRYRSGKALTHRSLIKFAAIAVCAGLLDEFAQGALENGRSAEVLDFAADCGGILVAYITAPPAIKRVVKNRG